MVMKKFTNVPNFLAKRASSFRPEGGESSAGNTPDANALKAVKQFCESGSSPNSGDEILHLPIIVEAAESSPQAASAAANQIRKFLSKDYYLKAPIQYNAVMLIRILTDNPGPSFTRNMDAKFVDTVKQLLRTGRDPSVQQILRETLVALDHEKAYDTNLNPLFAMWRKECAAMTANPGVQLRQPHTLNAPAWSANGPVPPSQMPRGVPPPAELAARVEEARTSAKLLLQLVQSTPPQEFLHNDLVKEFAQRCASAARSIEGYIQADSPAPDEDTMLTLIETSEQLSLATSKHHRAVLQARRATGVGTPSSTPPPQASPPPLAGAIGAPPGPPPQQSSLSGLTSASVLPTLPDRQNQSQNETKDQNPSTLPAPLQVNLREHGETSALDNPFGDHNAAEPQRDRSASPNRRPSTHEHDVSPSSLYGTGTLSPGRDREYSEGAGTMVSALSPEDQRSMQDWTPEGVHRNDTVSPMEVRQVQYRF